MGPNAGSSDVGPNAGSSDVGPNAGSSDVEPNAGSSDVGPNAGSSDVGPNVGTNDMGYKFKNQSKFLGALNQNLKDPTRPEMQTQDLNIKSFSTSHLISLNTRWSKAWHKIVLIAHKKK